MAELTIAAAIDYYNRGWRPVPIMPGHKRPALSNWPDFVATKDTLAAHFKGCNIGVILGRRSGHLVDIDLDCPEALELADEFLPVTQAEFGRASKPRSHRLYIEKEAHKAAFPDPLSGDTLLEIRTDGKDGGVHQTVFPPSVHPSGEIVTWVKSGEPQVPLFPLQHSAAQLAIASLYLRYIGLPPGGWQSDTLAVLWEFDHELARPCFGWMGWATPDQPRRYMKRRSEMTTREIDLYDVVKAIPNNADWELWNKIGMGIWNASQGSEEGYFLFDMFSAKSAKYQPQAVIERWRNYTHGRPDRIGLGTLVHLAREAGWSRSN